MEIYTGTAGNDKSYLKIYLGNGTGSDTLYGYGGEDTLQGYGGSDTLYGGIGNDLLLGNAKKDPSDADGSDTLYGEDGNDTLYRVAGYDRSTAVTEATSSMGMLQQTQSGRHWRLSLRWARAMTSCMVRTAKTVCTATMEKTISTVG